MLNPWGKGGAGQGGKKGEGASREAPDSLYISFFSQGHAIAQPLLHVHILILIRAAGVSQLAALWCAIDETDSASGRIRGRQWRMEVKCGGIKRMHAH